MAKQKEIIEKFYLGKKLENAYSVKNMEKAYLSLKKKHKDFPDLKIETTHLYVRFYNLDSDELEYIEVKNPVEIFTHPLDYELIGTGDFMLDKEVADLYSVVPVNYDFGKVCYEIIEKCYIPSEKACEAEKMVEEESLRHSGNNPSPKAKAAAGWKYPKGYIKVYDTEKKTYVPVQKVKVRTWFLMRISTTYTSTSGYYSMPVPFLVNPYYSVVFNNQTGFSIWGNLAFLATAYYNLGRQSKNGYSKSFAVSSGAWKWATINNAEYIYRETICTAFTIPKPISNLKIWCIPRSGGWSGSAPMLRHITASPSTISSLLTLLGISNFVGSTMAVIVALLRLIAPDIFYLSQTNETKYIFSHIFHESSHASHCTQAGSQYWSWYINQIIANGGYGNGPTATTGVIGVGEMWGYYAEQVWDDYYGIGADYSDIDDEWFKPSIFKDLREQIPGLSMSELFSCLTIDVIDVALLKSKILNRYGSYHGHNYSNIINQIFEEKGF